MQTAQLKVINRDTGIYTKLRTLREQGFVPANVYGKGIKNQVCAFSEKEIRKIFNNDFTANFILELDSEDPKLKGKKTLVKSLERDPLTWRLVHADLYELNMKQPLTVSLPIHFKGTAKGVKDSGGIFQALRRSVRIRALPNEIPEFIEIDISDLELGSTIHVGEVKFPEKLKVLDSAEFAIASVVEAEKEETPVAAAATPEAGAGAATAAATAAAPDAKAAKPEAKK